QRILFMPWFSSVVRNRNNCRPGPPPCPARLAARRFCHCARGTGKPGRNSDATLRKLQCCVDDVRARSERDGLLTRNVVGHGGGPVLRSIYSFAAALPFGMRRASSSGPGGYGRVPP